ncbi:MAG TPA: hypothetical protein VI488_21700 [Candidatus Angelobacter sp.]
MYRDPPSASLMRRIGLSFLLGFALFGLGALVNALLERSHVGGMILYVDDVILGLIAGLLVFFYEQRRHRATLDKIRVIAEMNHHVRNALQAIALSPYAEKSWQIELIGESAERIQWALREILPGEVEPVRAPSEKTIAS